MKTSKERVYLERILEMLKYLAKPCGHTAAQLGTLLGLSRRTVLRYFEVLRQAEVPLEDLGRGRGYRVHKDYRAPVQALTAADILPMILGVQVWGSQNQVRALGRLQSFVANGSERSLATKLSDHLVVDEQPPQLTQVLEMISMAMVQGCQLEIDYESSSGKADGQSTKRVIEPLSLFLRSSVWYVDAFDYRREELRTFRTSRIQSATAGGQAKHLPDRRLLKGGFHPWDIGLDDCVARLSVDDKLLIWLQENPPHPSQTVNRSEVTYQIKGSRAFLRWVLSLEGCRLLGSDALLANLQVMVKQLADVYLQ